ncbi:MAG: metalloregulator ArsR/SmtB family transcription factor [Candidatus Eiseniibacteriota bacterium]|jgi:DNA-binding transcriptional ArsR family regulator
MNTADSLADIARALADPGRIRVLRALRGRELCVCQLTEFLELATSTVSRHMAVLRQAGLVESRRRGRWVFYRRPPRTASPAVRLALAWLDRALAAADRRGGTASDADDQDARRLERILATPTAELCATRPED